MPRRRSVRPSWRRRRAARRIRAWSGVSRGAARRRGGGGRAVRVLGESGSALALVTVWRDAAPDTGTGRRGAARRGDRCSSRRAWVARHAALPALPGIRTPDWAAAGRAHRGRATRPLTGCCNHGTAVGIAVRGGRSGRAMGGASSMRSSTSTTSAVRRDPRPRGGGRGPPRGGSELVGGLAVPRPWWRGTVPTNSCSREPGASLGDLRVVAETLSGSPLRPEHPVRDVESCR